MAGITHKKSIGGADNPAYDVSSGEWNETHDIKVYYDIEGGAGEPATPAAGKRRRFFIDAGTSPNRRIAAGVKFDNGFVYWEYDFTI